MTSIAVENASRPALAVATYAGLPDLEEDGALLLEALRGAGLEPNVHRWDDPAVDWSAYPLVLVRSTWDYMHRREEFLNWVHACRATANPADVIAWNTDKHYLAELATQGVPVVPTVFFEPGSDLQVPETMSAGDIVVKPAVGAGSGDTGRFAAADPAATALARRMLDAGRSVLVQPYLDSVETSGETSVIYLGGSYSHSISKAALLTEHGARGAFVEDEYREDITPAAASEDQHEVADQVLAGIAAALGNPVLSYARIDLLPGTDGVPVLLEVELTEPSLFLSLAPPSAVQHWARHLAQLVDRQP